MQPTLLLFKFIRTVELALCIYLFIYLFLCIYSCVCLFIYVFIPGVPKKWNGGFSVPCELKISYFLTLDKASSAEENDTKIIIFG